MRKFVNSFLAGVAISLGGLAYLNVKELYPGSVVIAALLFSVGLFCVCTRKYLLFTGKVCYLFDHKPRYIIDLIIIWFGNLAGCIVTAGMLIQTSLCQGSGIDVVATEMCDAKLANSPISLFILGFFCNMFIYIAVHSYAYNNHVIGKYLAIIFGVMCFILAGTEHCVADMFYFCISGEMYYDTANVIKALLIITAGNVCGAVFLPLLEEYRIERRRLNDL